MSRYPRGWISFQDHLVFQVGYVCEVFVELLCTYKLIAKVLLWLLTHNLVVPSKNAPYRVTIEHFAH